MTGRLCAGGALVAAALTTVAAVAGCGDDEPPAPTPAEIKPVSPTYYMTFAVGSYRDAARPDHELPWKPVRKHGRVWKGDPHTYEKVCGANFLLPDGTIPKLSDAPDGARPTDTSQPNYYDWLQHHPKKWSAFNAWLADPAVRAYVGPHADNFDLGYGRHLRRLGTDRLCTHRKSAGTPIHSASASPMP